MIKNYKLLFSILIIGLLASCNKTIRSDVMRFHQLPAPSGEKIVIVPMNPNDNGSLEFASYATLVGNALGRYGYVPANGEEPDLIVALIHGFLIAIVSLPAVDFIQCGVATVVYMIRLDTTLLGGKQGGYVLT